MNNPKFYIYGVPDGFNMLSGTPDEILYYQLFYDTSKRGREMRINRKANGETVYSYLIYNLVSCKGREGAFLGMSVVFFGNEYCTNPTALKELFEGVYNEVILKADDKDKIVVPIDGGNAVGRFCILKFDERQEMCEKIGRIIANNIIGELANFISTIDVSFDNSKEGRILTLPIEADNTSISQALHSYTWVSLSSECKAASVSPQKSSSQTHFGHRKTTPVVISQDLLSVHFINELTKKVGTYKDFIIKGLKGLLSSPDIAVKREEINHYLDTIEEYVGRQPELEKLKDDYMSIYKELVDLKSQPQNVLQQPRTKPIHSTNNYDDDKNWHIKLIQQRFLKIIVGLCAILVVVFVVVLCFPDDSQPVSIGDEHESEYYEEPENNTEPEKEFDENMFKNLLKEADYKEAWSMLQKVEDKYKKEELKLELQKSYRKWFDQEFRKCKNDLQGLKDLKKKIEAYVDFNIDKERQKKLLDECINSFKTATGTSEVTSGGASKRSSSVNGSTKGEVIKIFKAVGDYNKREQISASSNVIKCKRNDCFVVEGATLLTKDIDIEAVPKDGIIRIRVPKVGQFKVKLNQVEYTFQATM